MAKIGEKERESRSNLSLCLSLVQDDRDRYSLQTRRHLQEIRQVWYRETAWPQCSWRRRLRSLLRYRWIRNRQSSPCQEALLFFPSIFIFVWISMTKCPIKWILCGLFCFNRFSILKMLWHYSLNLLLLTWFSTNSFKFCRKLKQHQWRPTGRLRLQWRQRFVGPRPDCWRKFLNCKNWRARR